MSDLAKMKSTQGAIFIQPDGPNTMPKYLPFTDLDDIEESLGGITLTQSFDVYGNWVTLGHTQEAPEPISTTLTTYLGELADQLDKLNGCPFALYVMMRCAGRADVFANYRRAFVFTKVIPTSKGLMGLVKRNEPADAEHSVDIEAYPPLWRVFEVNDNRIQVTSTDDIRQITFCGEFRCASYCADPSTICKDGFYVTNEDVSTSPETPAVVAYTTDGGATWTATATDPFATGNISSVQCFRISASTTRVIVANGTTDVAAPAEVAYSDDYGANWTVVTVGSVNGQYINKLFVLGLYYLWAVTDDGYIYFSEDGGVTWAAQESGSITTADYFDINFVNENFGVAVGAGDVIAITRDGGSTWSAADSDTGSGADILTVKVLSQRLFWLGTDDGEIYFTKDYGDTFTERTTFSGSGTGDITAMDWINEYFGAIVHVGGDGYGRVHLTMNGGYDWTEITTNASAGLSTIFMCDPSLMFVGGAAVSSQSMLVKISN